MTEAAESQERWREGCYLLATGGTEAQFERDEEKMGHEIKLVQTRFLRNIKKDRVERGDTLNKNDSPAK